MSDPIAKEQLTGGLLVVLEEAFENVHGIFLDRGTSIFETLDTLSAEEASRPVSPTCATVAAHVEHMRFYLDVLGKFVRTGQNERVDWGEIWRTVSAVTPEEWDASKARLKASYQSTRDMVQTYDNWNMEDAIGGAIGMIAHSTYHLGEIRHALCTIKADGS